MLLIARRIQACRAAPRGIGIPRSPHFRAVSRSLPMSKGADGVDSARPDRALVLKRLEIPLGLAGAKESSSRALSIPPELTCSGETLSVVHVDAAMGHAATFDLQAFQRHLSEGAGDPDGRGAQAWSVLAATEIPSTQKLLEENAKILPDNLVVIADTQTEGKGRAGNTWVSPKGCLMCSFLCDLAIEGPKVPLLQYATTLAVVQALEDLCADSSGVREASGESRPQPFASIKWPNDIYVNGTKVGGVLCQTLYRGSGQFQLICGLGLNLDNEEPTFCVNRAVRASNRAPVTREGLLALVLPRLLNYFRVICEESFEPLHGDYYRFWLHSGQRVRVKADASIKGGAMAGGEDKDVVITGLSEEGFLLALDENHDAVELYPDGNR